MQCLCFFYIILYFLSRYLSVNFFFIFKIKLNFVFFLRLRTRYLSVKSTVRFDFFGLFNIKLSIFRVFRNIKLHFFFYFSYFLTLRYEIFDSEIAFPVLMPPCYCYSTFRMIAILTTLTIALFWALKVRSNIIFFLNIRPFCT